MHFPFFARPARLLCERVCFGRRSCEESQPAGHPGNETGGTRADASDRRIDDVPFPFKRGGQRLLRTEGRRFGCERNLTSEEPRRFSRICPSDGIGCRATVERAFIMSATTMFVKRNTSPQKRKRNSVEYRSGCQEGSKYACAT